MICVIRSRFYFLRLFRRAYVPLTVAFCHASKRSDILQRNSVIPHIFSSTGGVCETSPPWLIGLQDDELMQNRIQRQYAQQQSHMTEIVSITVQCVGFPDAKIKIPFK